MKGRCEGPGKTTESRPSRAGFSGSKLYLKPEPLPETPDSPPLPLPSGVEQQLRERFEKIAQTPPFKSAQLVSLAEEILRRCGEYDSPFREAAEQVRHLVYANRNRQIPALVHELLKG